MELIDNNQIEATRPGHPVRVLKEENFAIESLIKNTILPKVKCYAENKVGAIRVSLIKDVSLLLDINKHYIKKENLLFPYMEEYGMSVTPKVMLVADNEILNDIKELKSSLVAGYKISDNLEIEANKLSTKISDMISKEEEIMIPNLIDVLSEDEWHKIAKDSELIGNSIFFNS